MIQFQIDHQQETPIYIQLYQEIRKAIIHGTWETGARLPSVRQLALHLDVSKTTIEAAYQQLVVEGYISSQPRSGYYVNAIEAQVPGGEGLEPGGKAFMAEAPQYDFRNDYMAIDSFDFPLWRKYLNKALRSDNARFLAYGSPQGEWDLREAITRYARRSRGVLATPDQVVVGAGVQSLLVILSALIKKEFPSIGFEDPGFKQGRHVFREYGFQVLPVALEEDGISLASLAHSDTKAVYVSPSNQFPMGAVMPVHKRVRLLNWVHQQKGLIIEDDYDSELRYFGRPIPSLQGMDEGNRVVYLGTFSKTLLPSLRISYMILPPFLLERYWEIRNHYNQTASPMEQAALALFMKEGQMERHLRRIRKIYARKNQLLLDAIGDIMGERVTVFGGGTGLHILLELNTSLPVWEVVARAKGVGVRVQPLSNYAFYDVSDSKPVVILAYGGIPLEHIKPGVKLLDQVWFTS